MITKKVNRFAMVCAAIVVASVLFLGLFVQTSAPAHASALTTNLSIPTIAVDDQNWNAKKFFNSGDEARFVVYVHNSSNFPDYVSIKAKVINGNGVTLLNSNPWNVTLSGNATSGFAWIMTIPSTAPTGIYYYTASASDSLGTVTGFAVFQVSNVKSAHAIAWANSKIGSSSWNGWCEVFIENAWGTQYRYATAQAAFNALHTSTNWSPDIGALVWFAPNAGNGYAGHVGIYIGSGQFISATYRGVQINSLATWSATVAPYEGWGDAPVSWPGR